MKKHLSDKTIIAKASAKLNKYATKPTDTLRNEIWSLLGGLNPPNRSFSLTQFKKAVRKNIADRTLRKSILSKDNFQYHAFEAFCYVLEKWKPKYSLFYHFSNLFNRYVQEFIVKKETSQKATKDLLESSCSIDAPVSKSPDVFHGDFIGIHTDSEAYLQIEDEIDNRLKEPYRKVARAMLDLLSRYTASDVKAYSENGINRSRSVVKQYAEKHGIKNWTSSDYYYIKSILREIVTDIHHENHKQNSSYNHS